MSSSISVTILTKNSQKHIRACLGALQNFDEIIVLDNGSTDNTLLILEEFANVKVYSSPFIGFGALKNLAAQYASNPWILSIDSDEVITSELEQELLQLDLTNKGIVYSIKRNNYYRNKHIKACGWDNDYVLRLYHSSTTSFANLQVHEYVRTENLLVKPLTGELNHYAYESISQLILKSDKYTTLFAKENRYKKKSSALKSYYKGAFAFFKNYFLQRGFLYGYEGLTISFTNASYSFYKYMKLHEANQTLQTTLIITIAKDTLNWDVFQKQLETLETVPEEVIVIGSHPNFVAAYPKGIKVNNLLIPVKSYHLPNSTNILADWQKVILSTEGEFIVVVDGETITSNLLDNYKVKVQKGASSNLSVMGSNKIYTSVAFWKTDFLALDLSNAKIHDSSNPDSYIQALLAQGDTRVFIP